MNENNKHKKTKKDEAIITIMPNQSTQRYNESQSLNLNCMVDSSPIEYGNWSVQPKTNSRMYYLKTHPGGRRHKRTIVTTLPFTITKLRSSDSGEYRCCLNSNLNKCKSVEIFVQSMCVFIFVLNHVVGAAFSPCLWPGVNFSDASSQMSFLLGSELVVSDFPHSSRTGLTLCIRGGFPVTRRCI